MSMTWEGDAPPPPHRIGPGGVWRIVWRGLTVGLLTFGGLALLLLVRVFERPLCGLNRPVTPHITQFVCHNALRLLGLPIKRTGQPMHLRGAVVANHTSWLDIFVLNASDRIYFVSKSEVAGWPGIGWLARATGTLFIARDPRQAKIQLQMFEDRLLAGHRLLFFPEGTSTDGLRVLPFKTTLFAAFFDEDLHDEVAIQPVSVTYHAPDGEDRRFYGWWGDMNFGAHLLGTLAASRQGIVEVIYHAPVPVAGFSNRKDLASACERAVRTGHRPGARVPTR